MLLKVLLKAWNDSLPYPPAITLIAYIIYNINEQHFMHYLFYRPPFKILLQGNFYLWRITACSLLCPISAPLLSTGNQLLEPSPLAGRLSITSVFVFLNPDPKLIILKIHWSGIIHRLPLSQWRSFFPPLFAIQFMFLTHCNSTKLQSLLVT